MNPPRAEEQPYGRWHRTAAVIFGIWLVAGAVTVIACMMIDECGYGW